MFASITNGVFAVPENPVKRGFSGLAKLGYSMGQPVLIASDAPWADIYGNNGADAYGNSVGITAQDTGGVAASGSQYSVGPNGQLQYNQMGPDTSGYTASYCNQLINSGAGAPSDLFQCSIRGYVGANGIYKPGTYVPPAAIPPALVPDPPTSVTIPNAVMTVSTRPPSLPRTGGCATPGYDPGIDLNNCWLAVGVGIAAFFLLGGNRG